MTWASIQNQLQNDLELRSVLQFFIATFICLLITTFLWIYLGVMNVILAPLFAYVIGKRCKLKYQCTTQAAFLGSIAGFSLAVSIKLCEEKISHLFLYFFMLSIFHTTEYVFTALSNRRSLQPDSFLLNHSVGYWAAAVVSWIEFLVELHYFPQIKIYYLSIIGVFCCVIGEIIRKMAMMHAGTGFTHKLAMSKRMDHKLVTTGIYSLIRHPGYCGWFIWAVSTQLILCNPICIIIYAHVTWNFFSHRIYDEERDLVAFFGVNYIEYQQNVWSGVPFVEGYNIS